MRPSAGGAPSHTTHRPTRRRRAPAVRRVDRRTRATAPRPSPYPSAPTIPRPVLGTRIHAATGTV
jgi:hypothetical protein